MKDAPFDPRTSRNKRRRRVWITTLATITVTLLWIFRPHWHADESLIDPRLRALQKPYRAVESNTYFDEGSASVQITDAIGHREFFFIPYRYLWRKVYIRPDPHSHEGEIPASDHAATLQELTAILSDHCDDLMDYSVLYRMTGRPGDLIKGMRFRKWNDLKEWWHSL